ncbi:hypothetical protein F2P56_033916 [Juglans regia]|uniref:Reverse transcriptase zinc-binding domain-containing protein n=2 Tax=Juglans regia TaxID=51240 RepID=A0A833TCA8_JUGRE|nr:uncharacterized protein LOC109009943 [Juglans regia]KAF5444816.1 hypothetical protein F2P56_033916 [Juglans regia]
MVQSPVSTLGREATVAKLIDEDIGCWNYDLVRETFNKEEAAITYTIHVSRMSLEDKLYWGLAKNGLFSIKSAYYITMEIKRQYGGEQSTRNGVNQCNLLRRKITKFGLCPICEQLEETSGYVLWSCVATSDVWFEKMSKAQKLICREEDFLDTWTKLSQKLQKSDLEGMVLIFRKVWQRRNNWIFKSSFQSPTEVIDAAMTNREEYILAKGANRYEISGSPPMNRSFMWQAPTQFSYKVNWDAGFEESTLKMGTGIIIRNCAGDVIAALCMPGKAIKDVVVAEANAL